MSENPTQGWRKEGQSSGAVIHVHGAHDAEQTANAVMRKLTSASDYHLIDTDYVS